MNYELRINKAKKIAVIISPNWRGYAEKYLAECFNSIRNQDYAGEIKIFIADNESTDESYEYLKGVLEGKIPLAPFDKGGKYEIARNKNNDGFAKGNNDCIKLAMEQDFDYVALFNMDAVLEKDCVSKMVEIIENNNYDNKEIGSRLRGNDGKKIGAVQARIMLYDDKFKINSLGNITHFLGFGYAKGYGEEMPNGKFPMTNEIAYPSGAAVLFAREALEKTGLFDEEFWMYNEDQDLGWRLWLSGFKCVLAAEAVACHKYEFSRSIKKYYFMDRNRIIAILKNYRLPSLALILPAFLIMEIGLLFFAAQGGWFKEKIKVYAYFFNPNKWRYILRERKKIQNSRVVSDKNVIKLFSGKIWYQEIGGRRLKIANVVFNLYWAIIKFIIFW